jgi:selenide,water dikinase
LLQALPCVTGQATGDVILDKGISAVGKALLTDPQTSGGLLVSCAPSAVDEVLALFARDGFADAAVIGELVSGQPGVEVSS